MSEYTEQFYRRFGPYVLAVLAALLPLLAWGFVKAIGTNTNNVRQWLPQDYEETQTYRWFRRHFESDEFAVVSWDGCTLDDPRLPELAEAVARDGADDNAEEPLFAEVRTGPGMLKTLTEPPFDLSRERAIRRLRGFVIAEDDTTTAALVTLTDYGDRNRVEALDRLREVATGQVGIEPHALRLAGGPVFNAQIDVASERAIGTLMGWSVAISLCIGLLGLRSLRLTAVVFLTAVYCGLLSQALVYFVGDNLNLVLVVMPVLVGLLTLSAAVHLVNYYRDALAEGDPRNAPARAVRRGFAPVSLAAATTAIGLASLLVSHVVPVREFGLYSAVGISAGLAVTLLMLPSLLSVIQRISAPRQGARQRRPAPATPGNGRVRRLLASAAEGILRYRAWVASVCAAALVAGAWGVSRIETEVNPRRFFPEQSDLLQDYRWVEEEFGPVVPLEVVVVFDRDESPLDFFQRMKLVRDVQRELQSAEDIRAAVSAATFAPPLDYEPARAAAPGPGGVLSAFGRTAGLTPRRVWRTTLSRRLRQHRDDFAEHGYLSDAGEEQLWRISTRAARKRTEQAEQFLDDLASRVESFLDAQPEGRRAGVRVEYTGMVPLFYVAQRELLEGLFRSFVTAFGLIALLMIVVLRSVAGGLLAMLPNVFPAAVVFGTMGHLGIRVDIGSMLTASAAMGIAVDDTVHFLSWFRRGLSESGSPRKAILHAYRRCAAAMCQTTAIAGLGLLVFATSSFQPVAQFGLLIFVLLVVTLLGDLVFLPALLAGLGGRIFRSGGRPRLACRGGE